MQHATWCRVQAESCRMQCSRSSFKLTAVGALCARRRHARMLCRCQHLSPGIIPHAMLPMLPHIHLSCSTPPPTPPHHHLPPAGAPAG